MILIYAGPEKDCRIAPELAVERAVNVLAAGKLHGVETQ